MHKRVLLIDTDSQANASKVLLHNYLGIPRDQTIYTTILDRKPIPVHHTDIVGLDIAPSHILLSNTDVALTTAKDHREARLKSQLDIVKSNYDYDYVIIDCPPALSWLTLNSFTASDGIIVVISPGYFELDSIVQIRKVIHEVQEDYNHAVKLLGYVFNMGSQTLASRESLKILRQTYTDSVFKIVIPRNTDIRASQMNKTDVFSFNWTFASFRQIATCGMMCAMEHLFC